MLPYVCAYCFHRSEELKAGLCLECHEELTSVFVPDHTPDTYAYHPHPL